MKPLSVILAFIGLAVLGVLIAGCVKKPPRLNNAMFCFCIELGDSSTGTYAELKDPSKPGQATLHDKLNKAKSHKGKCDITFLGSEPGATPDPNFCEHEVALKTDRVIKSKLASNRGRDSSAANDPNLMNRVSSQDPADIAEIAKLLK